MVDRRVLLKRVVQGMGGLVTVAVGLPVLATGLSPALRRRRGSDWQPVGRLDEFAVGQVRRATVPMPEPGEREWAEQPIAQAVYVSRPGDDRVIVFSRSCTDLSCPVTFDEGSGWFFCPCHGGIFDNEGEPRAGPPNRPLYRYASRVREGVIEIDLRSLPPMV